ncbi:MAG: histidine phosphatase family protein [Burkholderiales bacterium]
MHLILWRHAEAEDAVPDSGRKLTAKGSKQAEKVGAWLAERLPDDARILVSPAARAQQTAAALKRRFETVAAVGLAASAESILDAAGWPDQGGTVVIIGHQPTLGEVAARLLPGKVSSWGIRKGALWWFTRRDRAAGSETLLRAVIGPDLV